MILLFAHLLRTQSPNFSFFYTPESKSQMSDVIKLPLPTNFAIDGEIPSIMKPYIPFNKVKRKKKTPHKLEQLQ